jgi:hypothetical protein
VPEDRHGEPVHVALDGTKVQAEASQHKAMSHERILRVAEHLQQEINGLTHKAEIFIAVRIPRCGCPGESSLRAGQARQ